MVALKFQDTDFFLKVMRYLELHDVNLINPTKRIIAHFITLFVKQNMPLIIDEYNPIIWRHGQRLTLDDAYAFQMLSEQISIRPNIIYNDPKDRRRFYTLFTELDAINKEENYDQASHNRRQDFRKKWKDFIGNDLYVFGTNEGQIYFFRFNERVSFTLDQLIIVFDNIIWTSLWENKETRNKLDIYSITLSDFISFAADVLTDA